MEITIDLLKKAKAIEYCRKSSEDDDKQAASLPDQYDENAKTIIRYELDVPEKNIYQESKSAKKIGRPLFKDMVQRIANGEVKYIVTWQLNRLSRNAVDAGEILYQMDSGKLLAIITPNKIYTSADKFIMYVEFGMSDKYSDDLSINVMRGMKSKLLRGWWPGQPKPGYVNLHDPNNRVEVRQKLDEERFHLLRAAIDKYLTGHFTVPMILDYLNYDLGYRSRYTPRTGGKKLHLSKFYALLRDPFYYGKLVWNGNEGILNSSCPRLITEDEYWKIQELLGTKGVQRPKKYFDLPYRGLLRCPECGGAVIPYLKKKPLKDGTIKEYCFLRCTKNKGDRSCRQQQITFESFENQMRSLLNSIEIGDEFYNWALKWIKKTNETEDLSQQILINKLTSEINQAKAQSFNLINMRSANEISSDEFKQLRMELSERQVLLQNSLIELHNKTNKWLDEAEGVITFSHNAVTKFSLGTFEEKADIARGLGLNFVLFDKKIDIKLKEPYFKFKENKTVLHTKPNELELAKALLVKDKSEITDPVILSWWARRESNPH